MKRLFVKIKPASVLLLLKDTQQQWYPSKLARSSNSSYVHTVNLLSKLRKGGIVLLEKKGKQNYYRLTDKGAQLAILLEDFVKKCDAIEQEQKASRQEAEKQPSSQAQPPAQQAPTKPAEPEKKAA
ncbi:MAG: hypothetical protein N3G22_00210 [Candidatus Micrarchaeota archaeon]|nr:hypothetical protein [Candidatus Micrarchaeota archaeon]